VVDEFCRASGPVSDETCRAEDRVFLREIRDRENPAYRRVLSKIQYQSGGI